MHPVHEYRKEVDDLRNELAELKARLGVKPPEAEPAVDPRLIGAPVGAFVDQCGIVRNGRGDAVVPADAPTYEEYHAAENAKYSAKQQAERAAMTAGLPDGFYRDFSNIVRRIKDGTVANKIDVEEAQLAAAERQQGANHRSWKVEQRLPVRPSADDDEGED